MFNVTQRIKLKRTSVLFLLFLSVFSFHLIIPHISFIFIFFACSGSLVYNFCSLFLNKKIVVWWFLIKFWVCAFFIECRVSQSVRPSVCLAPNSSPLGGRVFPKGLVCKVIVYNIYFLLLFTIGYVAFYVLCPAAVLLLVVMLTVPWNFLPRSTRETMYIYCEWSTRLFLKVIYPHVVFC